MRARGPAAAPDRGLGAADDARFCRDTDIPPTAIDRLDRNRTDGAA